MGILKLLQIRKTIAGHMRLKKILLPLVGGLCLLQLIRMYVENRHMQNILPNYKKAKILRILSGYSMDDSGRYRIHRFYKSEGFSINSIENKDVTLATHCTVDRLHHVIGLAESWGGPMSISIFAPGHDTAFAEDAIDGLRLCWPQLRKLVSFHIVYPWGERTNANMTGLGSFAYLSCKDIMRKMMLRKLSDNKLYPKYADTEVDEILRYPHNLLRNVALSGVLTKFVLSTDIELFPSQSLRSEFTEFAHRENLFTQSLPNQKESIYVLPTFEVRKDEEIGRRKKDLMDAIKKNNARPVLQETCFPCHKHTNYEKWLKSSSMGQRFGVGFEISFASGWEPFFIAKRNVPKYDESIHEYGLDKLSQMCHLKWKNYKFSILNHGFLLRKSYRYKTKMIDKEIIRRDNRQTMRETLQQMLVESGMIPKDIIKVC